MSSMNEEEGLGKRLFSGQCVGGPDDGNLITSSVEKVKFLSARQWWLDGPDQVSYIHKNQGTYEWDEKDQVFHWVMGADRSWRVPRRRFRKS